MDKDYVYDCETNSTTVYRNKYTGREIHIPKEEMTNGDIIKAIYPNCEIEEMGDTVFIERYDPYCKCQFNIKWWNTPYDYYNYERN